jgi:hypothetical protein
MMKHPLKAVRMLVCTKCRRGLPAEDFAIARTEKRGRRRWCRSCECKAATKRYRENREVYLARAATRRREADVIEKRKIAERRRYHRDIEKARLKQREKNKRRQAKFREYHRNYVAKKLRTDPDYKIKHYLRACLAKSVRTGWNIGSAVRDLGCTIPELRAHLEKRFAPGMSWENYGPAWHIDHIKPLSIFDLTNREEFLIAVNYMNLQPMWARENISKGGGRRYLNRLKAQAQTEVA